MAGVAQNEALAAVASAAAALREAQRQADQAAITALAAGCSTRQVGLALGLSNSQVWRRYEA